MPKISCSWCTGLAPGDKTVTPPCFDCVTHAKRVIAASRAPADSLRQADVKLQAAVRGLKAAKKLHRKARKIAAHEGLFR